MKTRAIVGTAVGVGLALVLAACGGDDMGGMDHGDDETTEAVDASAGFTAADVTFAQGMIPHHEQAVEMAGLAEGRAESAEVEDLAARIEAAQEPEIEQLQGLLAEWGQEPMADGDGGGGMDHGAGMMDEDDMAELEAATGAEFDELFLTLMIEHHEGAVEMARAELADGESTEARELAQAIIDAQEGEIEEMQGLLDAA